ncbi:uncharacterized protein LOC111788335 isoform X2 [Cucurbita pepo subsp. pepo]|uniref:uncharacterized protein LOC111788335 isoform X2 n=1 Tax=Cucurbita pepo subsp. pepo TaxID=3664 RepID=UPI000C9D5C76|nr:uncharacterized protein LOC111788335 isoform X2 [Cucurbita pepo subsp. pepo]
MASAALLALLRPRGTRGFLRPSVCFYFCNAVAWVVHSKGIVGLWGCPDRCNDSGSLGILGVEYAMDAGHHHRSIVWQEKLVTEPL